MSGVRSVLAFIARRKKTSSKTSSESKSPTSDVIFNVLYRKRDAVWAEFQASLSTPQPSGSGTGASQPRMVIIEKRYRFAGEEVV